MNTTRTIENRLSNTANALNIVLPLYADVRDLQISHKERAHAYVQGTLAEAAKITEFICSKLRGTRDEHSAQRWQAVFWYSERVASLKATPPPSVELEEAWVNVVDVFLKHQNTSWDGGRAVQETVNSDSEGDESELEDTDERPAEMDEEQLYNLY